MTLNPPAEHVAIDVWTWPLGVSLGERHSLLHLLSDDERIRADRFVFAEDRNACVVARGRMRQLLGGVTGIEPCRLVFGYERSGKPYLEGGPHFSLSHSGGLAALAVCSDYPIGIDIEKVRSMDDAIAARFFCKAENEALEAAGSDRPLAFFRCWTRKEAVVKALGCGLLRDTRSFTVATERPAIRYERLAVAGIEADERGDRAWALLDLDPGEGFAGAIALKCFNRAPRVALDRNLTALADDRIDVSMAQSCVLAHHH